MLRLHGRLPLVVAVYGEFLGEKKQMSLNSESLPANVKAVLLARLANELTICARDTYEVGTERVLQPEVLRAYNELLHRVTVAARDHLLRSAGYSLQDILEM